MVADCEHRARTHVICIQLVRENVDKLILNFHKKSMISDWFLFKDSNDSIDTLQDQEIVKSVLIEKKL